MRRPRRSSPCPAPDCRAASPHQHSATDRLKALGVTGDWVSGAERCMYCGCVYVRTEMDSKIIKGWLDAAMGPQGWHESGR